MSLFFPFSNFKKPLFPVLSPSGQFPAIASEFPWTSFFGSAFLSPLRARVSHPQPVMAAARKTKELPATSSWSLCPCFSFLFLDAPCRLEEGNKQPPTVCQAWFRVTAWEGTRCPELSTAVITYPLHPQSHCVALPSHVLPRWSLTCRAFVSGFLLSGFLHMHDVLRSDLDSSAGSSS